MLSFLGLKKKSGSRAAGAGGNTLSPGVAEAIINALGVHGIPVIDAHAFKVFTLANDPNSELDDFIELLEHDEPLSARVIKISNSVFFAAKTPCSTIQEALHVIGLNELRSLLQASTLKDTFGSKDPARKYLWSNSVATALIGRRLATQFLPKANCGEVFLGGLLSDIGKLVLLYKSPETYRRCIHETYANGVESVRAEEEIYPFNHTHVGALIADRWHFPKSMREIILHHHDSLEDAPLTMPSLIHCADSIAHGLGLGHDAVNHQRLKNFYCEHFESIQLHLGITSIEGWKSLLKECTQLFDREADLYAL